MSDDRAAFEPPPPPAWFRPIDRLVTWQVERMWAIEEARINGNRRLARRTVLLTGVKFLFALGLILVLNWAEPDSRTWSLAVWCTGATLGFWVMATLQRQQAFGRGWRKGRQVAFAALREAEQRGHSVQDWYLSEIERDLNTPI